MNAKTTIALVALVFSACLFASNSMAGPGAASTHVIVPTQQTTSGGGAGVASPDGGGGRCTGPRCRRLSIQQRPGGGGGGGGTSGNGDVSHPTPHQCYMTCMEAVGNADRCIDDCYNS